MSSLFIVLWKSIYFSFLPGSRALFSTACVLFIEMSWRFKATDTCYVPELCAIPVVYIKCPCIFIIKAWSILATCCDLSCFSSEGNYFTGGDGKTQVLKFGLCKTSFKDWGSTRLFICATCSHKLIRGENEPKCNQAVFSWQLILRKSFPGLYFQTSLGLWVWQCKVH